MSSSAATTFRTRRNPRRKMKGNKKSSCRFCGKQVRQKRMRKHEQFCPENRS